MDANAAKQYFSLSPYKRQLLRQPNSANAHDTENTHLFFSEWSPSPDPLLPPPIGNTVPQDDFSKDLQSVSTPATTDPKIGKMDTALQTFENGIAEGMAKEQQGAMIVTVVETGLNAVGEMKAFDSFMEGMPILMKVLHEVAELHPFIKVALMPFQAAWELEQKRRENDGKVTALLIQMREMMIVLEQLKKINAVDEIKGQMEGIAKSAGDDIKACARGTSSSSSISLPLTSILACDTYSKKKLVVKVLMGPAWNVKLASYAGLFDKHRSEFNSALLMHTAFGVGAISKTTEKMNATIEMMAKMLQQLETPAHKEMSQEIEKEKQRGGQWLDDNAFQKLAKLEAKLGGPAKKSGKLFDLQDFEAKSGQPAKKSRKSFNLEELKEDLQCDPDTAIDRNMDKFNRKFDAQTRQITEEMDRLLTREGDRVINAVTAGPHDRIIDPDVHEVWKDMGWRSSVKARHFVMALRDHFQERRKTQHLKEDKDADGRPQEPPAMVIKMADEWALGYINVIRLQQISEAFDDDASGFVTLAEVNEFTKMRPKRWSLPHWIAYWSIGHHQAMMTYKDKITKIVAKMFAIIPSIDPVNKTLSESLNPCYVNAGLQEKFATYVTAEEARLREKLEDFQYDIDAPDTLELVTGPGRIDRFVLPLVYLLLERHFEIFRVCQKRMVHPDELDDAAASLGWVFDAVNTRLELLQSTFKQQKLDLKQEFKSFSHGLYEYMNDPDQLWDAKLVKEAEYPEYPYDDKEEAQDIDISEILNHHEELLDFAVYALSKDESQPNADEAKALSGFEGVLGVHWNAHLYLPRDSLWPSAGMFSITLKPSSAEGEVQHFTGSSRSDRTDFNIVGECRPGNATGLGL